MRSHISLSTLFVVMLLLFSSRQAAQTPDEKPLYRATGNEATLVGTISVKGIIPKPLRIDTSADPICTEFSPQLETDSLVTNENRLLHAFVYVKGASLAGYRFELPNTEVELQRQGCKYSPHLVGLRVGQVLRIVNNDPTQHNTHPTPKINPEWNQSQPPNGPPILKTYSRPEVLIPFKCNQHPWEKAYVAVLSHPFFAVTDQFGRFEIRGLPAGTYTLTVWHEQLGEQQVEVSLAPAESRNVDFTFEVGKKH